MTDVDHRDQAAERWRQEAIDRNHEIHLLRQRVALLHTRLDHSRHEIVSRDHKIDALTRDKRVLQDELRRLRNQGHDR